MYSGSAYRVAQPTERPNAPDALGLFIFYKTWFSNRMKTLEETVQTGGVAVIPSDTLYGVMGSARNPETVEKIYKIRGRDRAKPFIVLIPDASALKEFGITPTSTEQKVMANYWPGKVTIVLSCLQGKYMYLHRSTGSIAFRVPDKPDLQELLKVVGPLVAPSANPEGKTPAYTIEEARTYFGDTVDFYQNVGRLEGEPSTLIKVEGDKIHILREGAVKIHEEIIS